ncbi:MAG: DNA recombination protein RmuC [Candidatus Peribacteraceae bacterium]|nr:DNA recombination protein RmuC [Candidatus Peribacteraceae bacterium]
MNLLSLLIGAVVGVLGGYILGHWLGRRSTNDLESIIDALSAKTVTKQAEHILNLAESKLSGKKDVIDTSLQAMKSELKRVEDLLRKIGDGNVQVGTRLDNAAVAIKELSETTGGIRNALSSNSLRGNWGERMAEDVLRLSGLMEGINYMKQTTLETGSKPDFTFLLPQKRRLNMDVKFPFNNYQLYVDAKTEKDKEDYKEKFLKDVRKRLKEVQTRDYINPEDGTVDYVLLFVPNEQIFGFINEIDRSLIDEAMRGKTILCSPLSLYAILAVIRQSMDNFSMESKSQEMLSIFGAFKMQWEKFKDQMETVRERFESVHKGYEELTGTRERQLDRQLQKIEEIRIDRAIDVPSLESTIESAKTKASRKLIAVE